MNRFVRIAGTVLLASVMAGTMSGAWAQAGKGGGNGREMRNPDARQSPPRQSDADRRHERELSPEERERLRSDIREHGRDVYRDRDRDRNRDGDRRPRRVDRTPR